MIAQYTRCQVAAPDSPLSQTGRADIPVRPSATGMSALPGYGRHALGYCGNDAGYCGYDRWSFITLVLLLFIMIGCGDQPSDPPILPPPIVWMGSLSIVGEIDIDGSTVQPDSINVILDGDSLGTYLNPCTIPEVPEGVHSVATYYRLDLVTYTSPRRDVAVSYNQTSAVNVRLTRADLRGLIRIRASTVDLQVIDSIKVLLDGSDLGWGDNPRLIDDVTEGLHKITVMTDIDDTDWEGYARDIAVNANDTSDVDLELIAVSPLKESHAPELVVTDLDGERHILSDHWGEVIYLYFFEHT